MFGGDGHVVVMASWVCTYFDIHQIEHFKYIESVVYSLCLNRVVKKKTGRVLLRECSDGPWD